MLIKIYEAIWYHLDTHEFTLIYDASDSDE